MNVAINFNMPI